MSPSSARPSIVVTGTSTGIGYSTVKVLIDRGFHVFGTVRKQPDADRLSWQFGPNVTPLLLDVTDEPAVFRAAAQVAEFLGNTRLFGLVNNAGIVVSGPLLHISADEIRYQFEANVIAPVNVVRAFAPLLGVDPQRTGTPGRIVNISSVGGTLGFPFLGAYIGSKHALEGISQSLRRELLLYGIDVIVIGPGSVASPIWDKAEAADYATRFGRTDYGAIIDRFTKFFLAEGRRGLSPDRIGESVHRALTTAHPKARYAVVPQRLKNWTIPMLLPTRWLDRLIGKQFGLLPPE
jgi:NAD(P)-dependent dehydrogenase (short-subunit alcohol dehydrogenase family)